MDAVALKRLAHSSWIVSVGLALALVVGAAPFPEEGTGGMVAADHVLASEAGAEVLRAGGNAVDAAIAAALAEGVVQPAGSGLGGGGFAIVSGPDGTVALDFRETAPALAHRDMFADPSLSSSRGAHSVAVPGEGPGLATLHARYGQASRRTVAAPAIRYAKRGFEVGPHLAFTLDSLGDRRAALEGALFARSALSPGDIVTRRALARALGAWVKNGGEDFQTGWIAQDVVAATINRGGALRLDDLAAYRPVDRTVLVGSYRGWKVETMPPPSSGGAILLQCLAVLEGHDLPTMDPTGSAYIHLLAETMKHGFADRAAHMGDPDRVEIPLDAMLAPSRIEAVRQRFDPAKTFPPEYYGMSAQLPDDHGTAHISVIAGGMAVALTTTVNLFFGSEIVAPRSGIVLNDEMDDFVTRPGVPNAFGLVGAESNAIAPGARPLSSMTPTILTAPDGRRIAVGAGGGPLIISATLQVIVDIIDFGLDPAEATSAPRVHHQWSPDVLKVDEGTSLDTITALEARGHRVERTRFGGAVQVVVSEGDRYVGASDPRRGGMPAAAY